MADAGVVRAMKSPRCWRAVARAFRGLVAGRPRGGRLAPVCQMFEFISGIPLKTSPKVKWILDPQARTEGAVLY